MAQQASLFGPSAEELMYAQRLADQERQQQQYMATLGAVKGDVPGFATGYAMGYGGGQSLGQAVGGLFGQDTQMADPRIAKAQQLESLMQGMSGTDLNDPAKLQDVAAQLQKAGRFQEALYFSDRAAALTTAERELRVKEAASNLDFKDVNAFLTQVRSTTEKIEDNMASISNARRLSEILKRDKNNAVAKSGLDNFIAKATGDARLSEAEVNRVAAGGSIARRVADKLNNWITGQDTPATLQDKIEVINAMEIVLNERYAEERNSLINTFAPAGIPQYMITNSLPEKPLSRQAQEYFNETRLKDTGGGDTSGNGWTMTKRTTSSRSTGSNRQRLMSGGN